MPELIVTEKPSAAKKIAEALAEGKPSKEAVGTVPFYRLRHAGKDIIVCCAVGHLYTIGEIEKTPWSVYPVFKVDWVPTHEVDKHADFSKKYISAIRKLTKEADSYTVATDYDIEGEVIGINIIRKLCKKEDAARMKFSTLTKPDLLKSYESKSGSIDWGQAVAGETRHILDFYYGINLTRALTDAINKATKGFKVLSSGRVQGPALKIIVDREKEISKFIPVPFWQIELLGNFKDAEIKAMHKEDKFWEKEKADAVMQKVDGQKEAKVIDADKKQFKQNPPFPFNLTALQLEAHRCFKIKPKATLDVAQKLYTGGYISYPRTSSQKLPKVLGFESILNQLKKQKEYTELAEKILKTDLVPMEGKKTDDAHPSIYPTGIAPKKLGDWDRKIYDLIVKRFLSVFAEPATRETNTITMDVNTEEFITKGTVTVYRGWHEFYAPYVKVDETEIPQVNVGDIISADEINLLSKETKPPNRYTQSSIIHALEKKNLGTKATRASIVETLFDRGYVTGDQNIEATELGIKTVDTLNKYLPEILDEELTRQFEDEMEGIRRKKVTEEQVLERAKQVLAGIIDKFKQHIKSIGEELSEANQEAIKKATTVGKCPVCKDGELIIRKGRFGRFIACNNYPDCKTTFALPRTGIVKPTEKVCETCGMPMISVRKARQGPRDICINPECASKESNEDLKEQNGQVENPSFPEEGMQCPVCKEGKMVLRKSFYGHFLGCDRYPKCKTMMKIVDGKVDTTPISPASKKKKAKKKAVKKKAAKKKAAKKS